MKDERVWAKYDELREQLLAAIRERDEARSEVERLKGVIRAKDGKRELESQGVYQ